MIHIQGFPVEVLPIPIGISVRKRPKKEITAPTKGLRLILIQGFDHIILLLFRQSVEQRN